jgi:hypothetical protein
MQTLLAATDGGSIADIHSWPQAIVVVAIVLAIAYVLRDLFS